MGLDGNGWAVRPVVTMMTLRVSSATSAGPYVPASRQRWQLDAFADGATLSERHGRMISGSRHGGPPPRLQRGPRDATCGEPSWAVVDGLDGASSASAKMPIEHPIRWEPMAHRTGCPIGTDGRPMGILARLHRAPPGTTGGSHETFLTDSSFLTNQKRGILELLQDA